MPYVLMMCGISHSLNIVWPYLWVVFMWFAQAVL